VRRSEKCWKLDIQFVRRGSDSRARDIARTLARARALHFITRFSRGPGINRWIKPESEREVKRPESIVAESNDPPGTPGGLFYERERTDRAARLSVSRESVLLSVWTYTRRYFRFSCLSPSIYVPAGIEREKDRERAVVADTVTFIDAP